MENKITFVLLVLSIIVCVSVTNVEGVGCRTRWYRCEVDECYRGGIEVDGGMLYNCCTLGSKCSGFPRRFMFSGFPRHWMQPSYPRSWRHYG